MIPRAAFAAAQSPAGEIVLLRGAATATQDDRTLKLYPGAAVIVGDQLRTGKNARLKLRMIDGTEITLGENSEFVVREYEMNESAGVGIGALELTRGSSASSPARSPSCEKTRFQSRRHLPSSACAAPTSGANNKRTGSASRC